MVQKSKISWSFIGTLSFKNLLRHKRRTAITVSSVCFGVWLSLSYIGIKEYNYLKFVETASKMIYGHITVAPKGFVTSPSPSLYISSTDSLHKIIKTVPNVSESFSRIMTQAMLVSSDQSAGAMLLGVDEKTETSESLIVFQNTFPFHLDSRILGSGLFEQLQTEMEDRLVLHVQNKNNAFTSHLTEGNGTFQSGNPTLDQSLFLVPVAAAQSYLGYLENEASLLSVFVHDITAIDATVEAIQSLVPAHYEVLKWSETNPDLYSYILIDKVLYKIILFFVMFIVGCGILTTIFMNARERRKEIGIILSIGLQRTELILLTLFESAMMSIMGILAGLIVFAPTYVYLKTIGIPFSALVGSNVSAGGVVLDLVLRCSLNGELLLSTLFLILVMTIAFSLYPAWKLSRENPIEAMGHP